MMNLNIDVPNYTTLSLGMKKLKIKLPTICKDSGGAGMWQALIPLV